MNSILGKGSESTLRIDEPLHFIFLVAYLITYFCCAYLLFICFKHCRRFLKRKEKHPRPATFDRLRNVAEAMNNLHCASARQSTSGMQGLRNIQVSVGALGRTHSELCPIESLGDSQYNGAGSSQTPSESDMDNTETNTSILITPHSSRRNRSNQHRVPVMYLTIEHDLPDYDTVSQSEVEQESPPPSYADCVPPPPPPVIIPIVEFDNNSLKECSTK